MLWRPLTTVVAPPANPPPSITPPELTPQSPPLPPIPPDLTPGSPSSRSPSLSGSSSFCTVCATYFTPCPSGPLKLNFVTARKGNGRTRCVRTLVSSCTMVRGVSRRGVSGMATADPSLPDSTRFGLVVLRDHRVLSESGTDVRTRAHSRCQLQVRCRPEIKDLNTQTDVSLGTPSSELSESQFATAHTACTASHPVTRFLMSVRHTSTGRLQVSCWLYSAG